MQSLMKKIFSFTIVLFFFYSASLIGQQIYFCENVTNNGEPENARSIWQLEDGKAEIEILFDNGEEYIPGSILYLFIDKKYDNTYEPFDSKTIQIENEITWLSYNFAFSDYGSYDVYFMDMSRNKLASKKITIAKQGDIPIDHRAGPKQRLFSSNYYSGIKLTYCERVIADKPVNVRDYTSLSKYNGEIYAHLKQSKPLNTDTVYVEVWFKEPNWDEFSEFIESKKYRINKYWLDTFFRYKFTKAGVYKFMIYDENYKLMLSTRPVRVYE
jgi:hypothetical protein